MQRTKLSSVPSKAVLSRNEKIKAEMIVCILKQLGRSKTEDTRSSEFQTTDSFH